MTGASQICPETLHCNNVHVSDISLYTKNSMSYNNIILEKRRIFINYKPPIIDILCRCTRPNHNYTGNLPLKMRTNAISCMKSLHCAIQARASSALLHTFKLKMCAWWIWGITCAGWRGGGGQTGPWMWVRMGCCSSRVAEIACSSLSSIEHTNAWWVMKSAGKFRMNS